LLGGFSGIGGGPFYGTGYYGGGGLGLVVIVLLILLLLGKFDPAKIIRKPRFGGAFCWARMDSSILGVMSMGRCQLGLPRKVL